MIRDFVSVLEYPYVFQIRFFQTAAHVFTFMVLACVDEFSCCLDYVCPIPSHGNNTSVMLVLCIDFETVFIVVPF